MRHVPSLYIVASELNDPICHSDECQIGSFSYEATIYRCILAISGECDVIGTRQSGALPMRQVPLSICADVHYPSQGSVML